MTVTLAEVSTPGFLRRFRSALPLGGALPDEVWHARHRFLNGLAWFHAVLITLIGPIAGYSSELSIGRALPRRHRAAHPV